jgi:predicted metal-binding protein
MTRHDAPQESERGSIGGMQDRETTILVCVTCREADAPLEPACERPGARLHLALREAAMRRRNERIAIQPVECLSVCKRPCTIGFSAPRKWTYVYGDFAPDAGSAEAILDAAALYAATPDGLIPWNLRPQAFKKGVVARIPPLTNLSNADLPEAAE